jgi:hypothetical protein
MGGVMIKVLTIVVMTHGLRALGELLGPRWGGLLMGLPSSTAVTLYFLGRDRGSAFAAEAAEAGLLGLLGAVSAALVYAFAAAERRHPTLSLAVATAAYLLSAATVHYAGRMEMTDAVLLSLAAIVAASCAGRYVPTPDGAPCAGAAGSKARSLVLRTVVPAVSLLTVTGLAGSLGPRAAGVLGTFPAMFLAVAFVTHLEVGPAVVYRTAVAFVPGNLSMVAFLTVLALVGRTYGLAPAFVLGYIASLAALALEALGPGRPGCLPTQVPHRSGRAQLGTRFVTSWIRLAIPSFVPWSSPPARDRAVDQPGVGEPELQPAVTMETAGSPRFPSEPRVPAPCCWTPVGPKHTRPVRCDGTAPACVNNGGSASRDFGARQHGRSSTQPRRPTARRSNDVEAVGGVLTKVLASPTQPEPLRLGEPMV